MADFELAQVVRSRVQPANPEFDLHSNLLIDLITKEDFKMIDFELAQKAYTAYGETTGFKNYQGLPMPAWSDLTPMIQMAWNNAALKIYMDANPPKETSAFWRNSLDPRQLKALTDAEDYAKDPFGDVAHNLKLLVAQLALFLDSVK